MDSTPSLQARPHTRQGLSTDLDEDRLIQQYVDQSLDETNVYQSRLKPGTKFGFTSFQESEDV